MNIRFFMLGDTGSNYSFRLEEELRCVFDGHLHGGEPIGAFETFGEATFAVRRALEDCHVIVFLVQPREFAASKKLLSGMLGFELKCNPTMLRKAASSAGISANEKSEFAFLHAFVPERTRLFSAGDGLYTGFSVISGNQTIIFVPLERGRTDLILSAQLIPYLNSAYHVNLGTGGLKTYYTDRLREKLVGEDITMSLAGTNTADFFKDYLSFDKELDSRMVISRKAERRGSAAPVDYVVNLSIAAAEFDNSAYGVAISNAYYTGESSADEKIVYVAVTNERETAVRKIHSVPGEEVPVFLTRCCSDVCAFICDVMEGDAERLEKEAARTGVLKRRYIAAIAAVILVIGSVTFFGLTYFGAHGYSLGKWFDNVKNYLLPGSRVSVSDEVETMQPGEERDTVHSIFDVVGESAASSAETQAQTAESTTEVNGQPAQETAGA